MAKRFKSFSRLQSLSLFLSLSLSLIDFFFPVFSCFQMIFYENAHFSYTVKFIFRECASCDGYFDWKNKEWVLHMSYKQKAVRAHCIGHKNCWLTLNLLLLRLFITFLCVCVWLRTVLFFVFPIFVFMCTFALITCKCDECIIVMHWKSSCERSVGVSCHSLGQGSKLIAVSPHCSQYFECNHVMMSVIFPVFCIVIQHTMPKHMQRGHKNYKIVRYSQVDGMVLQCVLAILSSES